MKIEATKEDIRVLLELTDLDEKPEGATAATHARIRAAVESRLSDDLLARYRRLAATGRYPAILAVEGGACSGCHVRLATMLAQLVRRSVGVYLCPGCHRMLYAPQLLSEAPAEEVLKRKSGSRRSRPSSAEPS